MWLAHEIDSARPPAAAGSVARPAALLMLAASLLALLIPTYRDLYRDFWRFDSGAHGPLILSISIALIFRQRAWLRAAASDQGFRGVTLLVLGVLLYVAGRVDAAPQLEALSQIPILLGLAGYLLGRAAAARLAFPILFLAFLVPIPGSLLAALTVPLKRVVSGLVVAVLHDAGLPVASSGVVIYVGPYQLLMADACSGLTSLASMGAIAVLFAHAIRAQASRLHRACLVASVLAVALLANVVRVALLCLVTYFAGDAAGAAFHAAAGLLEILFAVGALWGLNAGLGALFAKGLPAPRHEPDSAARGARSLKRLWFATALLAAGPALAAYLAPQRQMRPDPDLRAIVPARFGGWELVESSQRQVDVALAEDGGGAGALYDHVLYRTYADPSGHVVMLALAYGRSQRQEVKVHRPELCYAAAGFDIEVDEPARFALAAGQSIPGRRLVARSPRYGEAVSYWIRIGRAYSANPWVTRLLLMQDALNGVVPDGILVRVSTALGGNESAEALFRRHESFLSALAGALPDGGAPLLVAAAPERGLFARSAR